MGRRLLVAIIVIIIIAVIGRYLIFNSTMTESKARALIAPEQNVPGTDSATILPKKLNLPVPKEEAVSYQTVTGQTLTLFLLKEGKVFAYKGKETNKGHVWQTGSIGTLLAQEKKANGDSLMVVIMPSKFATYSSTVDLLDELTKQGIRNYTLHDATEEDEIFIEKKQQEESK